MDETAIAQTRNDLKPNTAYTDTQRDAAYLLWRTSCGRSVRKCSQITGISERAIHYWKDKDGWIERANTEDNDDYASSRIGVAAVVVNQLVPSILEAVRIRDNGTDDKVRLAAAQWLAGLAGVSPVSKIETAVTDKRVQIVEAAPDFSSMSVEQLREYELQHKRKRQIAQGDEPLPSPRMRT